MSNERMREEFCRWLLSEHGLESEWQADRNCFKDFPAHLAYLAWQASYVNSVPEWRSMEENPPFPFTGDICVNGKVIAGAAWCSRYWLASRGRTFSNDQVSHWKHPNPAVLPPAIVASVLGDTVQVPKELV